MSKQWGYQPTETKTKGRGRKATETRSTPTKQYKPEPGIARREVRDNNTWEPRQPNQVS